MSKEILVIESNVSVLGQSFNIYGDFENPLFLAKDVATWIEHNKASEMIDGLESSEKLVATISHSGQNRDMWLITEDGLYEVLMLSRKPVAKMFKTEVKKILKDLRQGKTKIVDDVPTTFLESLKLCVKLEEDKQLLLVEKKELQILVNANDSYSTILGYVVKNELNQITLRQSQKVGKLLTNYCMCHNLQIKSAQDERWGRVNSYPVKALQEIFTAINSGILTI